MTMSDDPFDAERAARRMTMMERRLRASRGENMDEDDEELIAVPRRQPRMAVEVLSHAPSGQMGCVAAFLAVALLAVLVLLFWTPINNGLQGLNLLQRFGSIFPTQAPATFRVGAGSIALRIQKLNRLETTSYTIERVIEADAGSEGWFGLTEDKLLLIAHGQVVAGIDLSKIRESDVLVSEDGSAVTIRLPAAQILSTRLDNDQTRVYDRDRGLFAQANVDLETQARQKAEQEILSAACEEEILQKASEEGRRNIEQLVTMLGFSRVDVTVAPVSVCLAPVNP